MFELVAVQSLGEDDQLKVIAAILFLDGSHLTINPFEILKKVHIAELK